MNGDAMRRHRLYLCYYLASRALFVVVTLTLLAALITWMEGVKSLYAGEEADAFYFVYLKLPSYLSVSLVPGFLLGMALGFHQLGKRHELVALEAQGLSPWQMAWGPALVLGLVFGAVQWVLLHHAVPATRHDSDALAAKLGILDPVSQLFSVRRHWVKTQDAFVYVERVGPNQTLENVVWVEKPQNKTPTLIAMASLAKIQPLPEGSGKVSLVMPQARVLDLKNRPQDNIAFPACAQALKGLLSNNQVDLDFDACPLSTLPNNEKPQTLLQDFRRQIPESLSVLMRLTGHPDGFFTGELRYLLTSAASYGYSLAEYSAALRARYVWPALIVLLALMVALLGVKSRPTTGVAFPFAIMLVVYLLGYGITHFVSKLTMQ